MFFCNLFGIISAQYIKYSYTAQLKCALNLHFICIKGEHFIKNTLFIAKCGFLYKLQYTP